MLTPETFSLMSFTPKLLLTVLNNDFYFKNEVNKMTILSKIFYAFRERN